MILSSAGKREKVRKNASDTPMPDMTPNWVNASTSLIANDPKAATVVAVVRKHGPATHLLVAIKLSISVRARDLMSR